MKYQPPSAFYIMSITAGSALTLFVASLFGADTIEGCAFMIGVVAFIGTQVLIKWILDKIFP